MTAENLSRKSEQIPASEFVDQLKEQLRATWEQLPDKERATIAVELLEDLEEGQRVSFREKYDLRWPITSESIPGTFALLMVTPNDLAKIGVEEEEIELFNDEKLWEMSLGIRAHYVGHGFWEELKYHTNHFLGGLRKQNQK